MEQIDGARASESEDVEGADDVEDLGDELDVPRKGRTALAVSLVVAVLAVAFVWVLATREPGTDRQASSPLIGQAAPEVGGRTLDGGSFDIDDHQGRWVVVNFFATWCVPCQQEHPELVAFDEAHRETGDARVMSVLFDDSPDDAREYFAENGGDWPVVIDERGIANDYGVTGVPETYLVAPNGRVAAKLIGGVTQDGLDRIIGEIEAATAQPGGAG
jgi:cytochrome c biogenesis protein CcmG, thiol:disulfide interchange protein DsbE